ncbi:MAG: DNRLRE domain-containing protein [Eubacteriales bacterium]
MATYSKTASYGSRVTQAISGSSNGRATYFNVGKSSGGLEGRYFVYFDLSEINSNAIISSATLTINQYDDSNDWSASVNVDVRRAASSWNANSITWNNQPSVFSAQDSAITISGIATRSISFDVTNAVKSAVSLSNYGFRIAAVSSSNSTAKYFRSDTYSSSSLQPKLTVSYTPILERVAISGSYRDVVLTQVLINGTWRSVSSKKVLIDGVWRGIY